MNDLQTLFRRSTVRGYELRQGVEQLTHHLAKALRLGAVTLTWTAETTTAAINARGTILVAAVRDDATIGRPTLVRYCGFIIHELLHRAHTQFGAMYTIQGRNANYRRSLLNAVEDARIERLGIATKTLGNIEQVLHDLMGQMVSEATAAVPPLPRYHGTSRITAPNTKQTNDSSAAAIADGRSSGSTPSSSRAWTDSAASGSCMTSSAAAAARSGDMPCDS